MSATQKCRLNGMEMRFFRIIKTKLYRIRNEVYRGKIEVTPNYIKSYIDCSDSLCI